RLAFTLVGGAAGFFGLVLLALLVTCGLAAMDSYGTPYLAPFAPSVRPDLADGLLKRPVDGQTTRPLSFPNQNRTRQRNAENNR
ncbi:MAG: spore germination protein, partial [Clostridiales bacterium]|nr:spore germination protein [Clostridiales bacterium]